MTPTRSGTGSELPEHQPLPSGQHRGERDGRGGGHVLPGGLRSGHPDLRVLMERAHDAVIK